MRHRWLIIAALVVVTGCHKSAERERNEAGAASRKVERTGARAAYELEHGDGKSIDRALKEHVEAIKDLEIEEDEAIAAAAKERASYKQLLEKEIGFVDQRVAELEMEAARAAAKAKDEKARDLAAAKAYRVLLGQDLEEVERTGEEAWPPLKDRIDRDLDEERPKSVPRAFDKSYGI